jgi:hypothetical protein
MNFVFVMYLYLAWTLNPLPRSDLSFSQATKRWSRPLFQLDLIRNVSFAFCHSVAHNIAAARTVQGCKGAIKGKAH